MEGRPSVQDTQMGRPRRAAPTVTTEALNSMPLLLSLAAPGFLPFRVAFHALHEKALTPELSARRQSQLPKGNSCRRNDEKQARPCAAIWKRKPAPFETAPRCV